MSPTVWLIAEKTIATYFEYLIGLYIADQMDELNVSTPSALAIAAIPAALTVIANGLPQVGVNLPFYVSLILNAVRTFVVSFIGYLVALPVFSLDPSVGKAAFVAALPTAAAVLKAGLATRIGDRTTPNVLPTQLDPQSHNVAIAA